MLILDLWRRAGHRRPPSEEGPGQATLEPQTPTYAARRRPVRSRYSIPTPQLYSSIHRTCCCCFADVVPDGVQRPSPRAPLLSAACLPFPPALQIHFPRCARPPSSTRSTASVRCTLDLTPTRSLQAPSTKQQTLAPLPRPREPQPRSRPAPLSVAAAAEAISQHGRGRPAQSARHQCVHHPVPIASLCLEWPR